MDIERRLRGTGAFVLTTGGEFPIDAFRIEQSNSGRTFLYCDGTFPLTLMAGAGSLASFKGQTTDGQFIRAQGFLNEYIATPREFCFILKNVEVGQVTSDGHDHCLALTNLHDDFSSTQSTAEL
jgi:hypothetical protein